MICTTKRICLCLWIVGAPRLFSMPIIYSHSVSDARGTGGGVISAVLSLLESCVVWLRLLWIGESVLFGQTVGEYSCRAPSSTVRKINVYTKSVLCSRQRSFLIRLNNALGGRFLWVSLQLQHNKSKSMTQIYMYLLLL